MVEESSGSGDEVERWERYARECRDLVRQLEWLAGRWRGHGDSSAGPRVTELQVRLLFDGTFLESRERAYGASGELEHEDLTLYGASPGEPDELWAQLFMPGGIVTGYAVTVFGDTMLCEPQGLGARISYLREGDGFRVTIYFPDGKDGWVKDSVLTYERVD